MGFAHRIPSAKNESHSEKNEKIISIYRVQKLINKQISPSIPHP